MNGQPSYRSRVKKLRFLVVAPFFPRYETDPLISGMVNNTAYLWSRVAELGHDVTVLTYGRTSGQWVYRNAKVLCVGPCPFKGAANSIYLEVKLLLRLVKEGIRGKFHQIRIHHTGGLSILFLKALGVFRAPIAVTAHGTSFPEIVANEQAAKEAKKTSVIVRLSRWIQYRLDRLLYGWADVMVSPSKFQVEELVHLYGVNERRITVLPHGYDETHFHYSRKSAEALRSQLGVSDNESIVLMVARAAPKKGIENFIETARVASFFKTDNSIRFIAIVGDPLHRHADIDVDALAKNSIDILLLLRNIPEQELPNYYSAADLCVIPSVGYESIPSVVYEACACTCTVLASRLPGIEEIIDGIFLDSVEPTNMAKNVIKILNERLITSFRNDYELGNMLSKQINVGFISRSKNNI